MEVDKELDTSTVVFIIVFAIILMVVIGLGFKEVFSLTTALF